MRFIPLVLVLTACNAAPAPSSAPPKKATMAVTTVGESVPAGAAIPVATVIARPDDYTGNPVLVEGRVRAACKKRGCWMELGAKDGGPACRVRFKDYGFFVPTDSAGADARLSGEVVVKTIAKDDVAHYESEGAKFDKAADGSARVVEITATGVELVRM
jgi:hypothetical protein